MSVLVEIAIYEKPLIYTLLYKRRFIVSNQTMENYGNKTHRHIILISYFKW